MKFSKQEKDLLIELICNEQIKHMIKNNEYETEKYNTLEETKRKIKEM